MAITIEKLRENIQCDYNNLCEAVGLKPLPLDIYAFNCESEEATILGMPIANTDPGYDQKVIYLPQGDADLDNFADASPRFPPNNWNLFFTNEWPSWRVNLWHEAVHQFEDKILGEWKGGNEHGTSWNKALQEFADRLCISTQELQSVTCGARAPMSR